MEKKNSLIETLRQKVDESKTECTYQLRYIPRTNERTEKWTDDQMDERTDGRTDKRTDEVMVKWRDRRTVE